ncbi:hypothetical protein AVEN_201761-1, partial [Araneus ventricosus]
MKFARGVVTYIANQHFPRMLLPYPPEFTETLTFDICARIHDQCIDFREDYPNAFEELFEGYEKTCNNFCIVSKRLADTFLLLNYTHSRLIKFCCEISEYAVCMYKEGCSDAFEIAIFAIFRVLWTMTAYWDNAVENPTISNHWRYLDIFCKWT